MTDLPLSVCGVRAWVIALGVGLCLAVQALSQTRQTIAPEGYIDQDGIWVPPIIPVCWENTTEPFTDEKGWVRDAVTTYIEDASSIHFGDWKDCAAKDVGVRITIADQNPTSDVGKQWLRGANGVKQQDNNAQWIQSPTRMVLNFTFNFPPFRDKCKSDREHCIRAVAVHEFLHSVGFLHEQLRADAPEECKQLYAYRPDTRGYRPVYATQDYDPDSHVNYCANMYRKPIRLSAGDLFVLRKYYQKP